MQTRKIKTASKASKPASKAATATTGKRNLKLATKPGDSKKPPAAVIAPASVQGAVKPPAIVAKPPEAVQVAKPAGGAYVARRIDQLKAQRTAYGQPTGRDDTYIALWYALSGGKPLTIERLAALKRAGLSCPSDGTFDSASINDGGVLVRLGKAGRIGYARGHVEITFTPEQAKHAQALATKRASIVNPVVKQASAI